MASGSYPRLAVVARLLAAIAVLLPMATLRPMPASADVHAQSIDQLMWPLGGGNVVESSPTIADADGDGTDEVLVGTTAQRGDGFGGSSRLIVYDDGHLYGLNVPGPVTGAPTVADIDADGRPEIIVGIGGDVGDAGYPGMVLALRYSAGTFSEAWRFQTQDWQPWIDGISEGVFATPTVCNLDGGTQRQVAFGSWDQHFYVLNSDGSERWSYYNADTIWSSMACADLNGDGRDELIGGADITGGGILPDGTETENGGFIYVFSAAGDVLVRRFVPEAVYSSPAIGDLDGNGRMEIVVGTGWYWWGQAVQAGITPPTPQVYAFSTDHVFGGLAYSDAAKLPCLPGWPRATDHPGFSSPALGDLDGDGDLEIVIGTGDPYAAGSDGFPGMGSVYAWHHTGALVSGWPVVPRNLQGNNSFVRSSPTIGDVDGDGAQEVVFCMAWDVHVYGPFGTREAVLRTTWTVVASPAIGDVDGDGHGELWIGGGNTYDQSQGYLWRFEFGDGYLGQCDWPQFHHDAAHTGSMPMPATLRSGLDRVWLLLDSAGAGQGAFLNLKNPGGSSLTWQAGTVPPGVHLAQHSGELGAGSYVDVAVYADGLGGDMGVYHLGEVVIHYQSGASSGSVEIEVRALVSDAAPVHLPLILG